MQEIVTLCPILIGYHIAMVWYGDVDYERTSCLLYYLSTDHLSSYFTYNSGIITNVIHLLSFRSRGHRREDYCRNKPLV